MPRTTEELLKDAGEEVNTIRAALESLGYLQIEEDKGTELVELIAEMAAKLRESEEERNVDVAYLKKWVKEVYEKKVTMEEFIQALGMCLRIKDN